MPINNEQVKFIYLSQNKYDEIETKSDNSIYLCDDTCNIYIGNKEFINLSNTKNELFPIGKIEVFFDNDDHSNYLGYTWERCLQGRVPVGIDSNDDDFNTIGNKLGEKIHKLTTEEMPSHKHDYQITGTFGTSHHGMHVSSAIDFTGNLDGIFATGGDQPHNNIQPSEVVSFWKRIA